VEQINWHLNDLEIVSEVEAYYKRSKTIPHDDSYKIGMKCLAELKQRRKHLFKHYFQYYQKHISEYEGEQTPEKSDLLEMIKYLGVSGRQTADSGRWSD